MARTPTYEGLSAEYTNLWNSMQVKPAWQDAIDRRARIIISNKKRYMEIQDATGVPWFVVGVIHSLEGSNNFSTHLHNGDSLARRTVNVPKGYPKTHKGPFTWEESAIDALKIKDIVDKETSFWAIDRIAYELERFNGFGYRLRKTGVNSPYLWSGTNHYTVGKFVSDGKYVSTAKSAQAGCMPIIKRIQELDIPAKEVIAASRKGTFLQNVKKFLVTTITSIAAIDWLGIGGQYWTQVQAVVGNNKLLTAALGVGSVWLIATVIQKMMVSEYNNGDYTPSGLKIPAADKEGTI